MGIFRAVVLSSSCFMPSRQTELPQGRSIGPKLVGDDRCWREALTLEQLSHQLGRCGLIASGLDQEIQDLTFSNDRTPEIHPPTTNRHKHLI